MDENDDIKKAIQELEELSGDDELRRMAELRLKGIRDEHAAIAFATKKGLEQGLQQGLEQGSREEKLKIAKKLLNSGMKLDDIITITELTEEELKSIAI